MTDRHHAPKVSPCPSDFNHFIPISDQTSRVKSCSFHSLRSSAGASRISEMAESGDSMSTGSQPTGSSPRSHSSLMRVNVLDASGAPSSHPLHSSLSCQYILYYSLDI